MRQKVFSESESRAPARTVWLDGNPARDRLVDALKELAIFYSVADRIPDAIQTYNEAITLQEEYPLERGLEIADSYSDLGQLYRAQEQADKANAAFGVANLLQQATLKYKRDEGEPLCRDLVKLGPVYLELNRPAQAIQAYRLALGRAVECSQEAHLLLADLLRQQKAYGEAEDNYKRLIFYYKTHPADEASKQEQALKEAEILERLGSLRANELKRPDQAVDVLQHALTLTKPEPRTYGEWEVRDKVLAGLAALRRLGGDDAALGEGYGLRLSSARFFGALGRITAPQRKVYKAKLLEAANDYVEYKLKHGDEAGAAEAYRRAFGDATLIERFGLGLELEPLSSYNSALEKYERLLRKLSDEPAALKVNEVVKKLRAREKAHRERMQSPAPEAEEEQAPEQTPSPTPTP
jgi:hypothetical protein